MKYFTTLPGTSRFPGTAQEWEAGMSASDFQLVARTADELGFDSMTIPEHIVLPVDLAEFMGPFWSHAMTVMAFIAGATTRIVVDSCVIVLPYHHPAILAKAVSTLDVLSGGRVRITIGVGHAGREFEVLDVPFGERGAIADEYLAAMAELWTSDTPEFHGRYVNFDGIVFEPKPIQSPHPPIWIGGDSKAAMRRAARHDGWFPSTVTPQALPECLEYVRSQPEFAERDRPFDVVKSVGTLEYDEMHRVRTESGRAEGPEGKQATVDAIGALQEIGVTWTSVPMPPTRSLTEYLERLQWIAEEIIPATR